MTEDPLVLDVERLTFGFDALAHHGRQVVFVPYAAPADRVQAEVVERFFSSHPLSENRMRDAARRAAALPRPPNAPVATARSSTFSEVNLMFAKD